MRFSFTVNCDHRPDIIEGQIWKTEKFQRRLTEIAEVFPANFLPFSARFLSAKHYPQIFQRNIAASLGCEVERITDAAAQEHRQPLWETAGYRS